MIINNRYIAKGGWDKINPDHPEVCWTYGWYIWDSILSSFVDRNGDPIYNLYTMKLGEIPENYFVNKFDPFMVNKIDMLNEVYVEYQLILIDYTK